MTATALSVEEAEDFVAEEKSFVDFAAFCKLSPTLVTSALWLFTVLLKVLILPEDFFVSAAKSACAFLVFFMASSAFLADATTLDIPVASRLNEATTTSAASVKLINLAFNSSIALTKVSSNFPLNKVPKVIVLSDIAPNLYVY